MKISNIHLSNNTKKDLLVFGILISIIYGLISLMLVDSGIIDPNYDYCKELSNISDIYSRQCREYLQEYPGSTGQQIIDGLEQQRFNAEQERLNYEQELLNRTP